MLFTVTTLLLLAMFCVCAKEFPETIPLLCDNGIAKYPPIRYENGTIMRCNLSSPYAHSPWGICNGLADVECNAAGYCCGVDMEPICDHHEHKPYRFRFNNSLLLCAKNATCDAADDWMVCSERGVCCYWRIPETVSSIRLSAELAWAVSDFSSAMAGYSPRFNDSNQVNTTVARIIDRCFSALANYVQTHVAFSKASPVAPIDLERNRTTNSLRAFLISIQKSTEIHGDYYLLRGCPVFRLSDSGMQIAYTNHSFLEIFVGFAIRAINDKSYRLTERALDAVRKFCSYNGMVDSPWKESAVKPFVTLDGRTMQYICPECRIMSARFNVIVFWERLRVFANAVCNSIVHGANGVIESDANVVKTVEERWQQNAADFRECERQIEDPPYP